MEGRAVAADTDAATSEDVCDTCGRPGVLMMCENHGMFDNPLSGKIIPCSAQHHFYCLGYSFPLAEEEEWLCEPCGGSNNAAVAHNALRAKPPQQSFECIICLEKKSGDKKVQVLGCDHQDHVCSECMFIELFEHRPKCPLCRRDATEIKQLTTGRTCVVDLHGEAEGADDEEEEGGVEDGYVEEQAPWSLDDAILAMRSGETVLDLDSKFLQNSDATRLAAALAYNSTLTILNLNGNWISSLRDLATALESNR